MVTPDLSQYLGVFLDEGNEQIDLLEHHLLDMEKSEPDEEMLQAMFRAAHTLKGSSRTMGFMRIGDLTHEMENVLDDLRNGKLSVSTEMCNALLTCLDLLKVMMAEVQDKQTDQGFEMTDVEALVVRLASIRENAELAEEAAETTSETAPTGWDPVVLAAAAEEGQNRWEVSVGLRPDCLMKSIRVMMVLAALREQSTVVACNPPEEKLEAEEFGDSFQVLITTDLGSEAIEAALAGVSEVDKVSVGEATAVTQTEPETKKKKSKAKAEPAKPAAVAADVKEAPTQAAQATTGTIRVAVSRLDSLLNLVGELVIDRSQISRIAALMEDKVGSTDLVGQLTEATHRIARITAELQDQIMKTRLLPVDGVFQRMPRMVRDVAQKTGKEIDFQISGGETELDRSLLDVLSDPIIHLLRNSIDHGCETPAERKAAGKKPVGIVTLAARHEENHIVIEITDDGRGINPQKIKEAGVRKGVITQVQADAMTDHDAIKLIFASGFSTAAELSDISGRGVGMDIVKSNIEKIGGRIHVDSQVGKGTRFQVHLPLTLAIVRALLVESGTATYAVPLSTVVETLRLGTQDVNFSREKVTGKAVLVIRGETVPLANLLMVLEGNPDAGLAKSIGRDAYVVVIGFADKKVGLCVDRLAGEQEVVIKSLGKLLGDVPGISGASILGDGRVALIVDAARAVNA
jgi:two-component system, chemotaxis family, sensor kinase CheA